ncbi:hypothetical protein FA15DRAFT_140849 [Coprinopsis marcescibilis]|uniref:BTB domain-containing protein n=1 Tax=Coprinopsis marcescibilis TaxID=230819 RepID=A0A5C3KJR5_COPMA|nr:hypothetical protein FA15DRAFT_140849 [Coprinopsis marcescibilis]
MWTKFECNNPDFHVRSLPDNVTFGVTRLAMQRSEVFRDMFSLCEPGTADASAVRVPEDTVDLDEPSETLTILLTLLHNPPDAPVETTTDPYKKEYDPATVIPLPLLESVILRLIDKYALEEAIVRSLEIHLQAHGPTHGLKVHCIALAHDRIHAANLASQYILPIAQYTKEEVKYIPTVQAYHNIVRFQDFRVKALRDLVLNEDIFPHGYGECSVHRDRTLTAWDTRRRGLLARIETGSDVAWEMKGLEETFRNCNTCHKACIAAVEMLSYKCRRIPWALHKLPAGYLDS